MGDRKMKFNRWLREYERGDPEPEVRVDEANKFEWPWLGAFHARDEDNRKHMAWHKRMTRAHMRDSDLLDFEEDLDESMEKG